MQTFVQWNKCVSSVLLCVLTDKFHVCNRVYVFEAVIIFQMCRQVEIISIPWTNTWKFIFFSLALCYPFFFTHWCVYVFIKKLRNHFLQNFTKCCNRWPYWYPKKITNNPKRTSVTICTMPLPLLVFCGFPTDLVPCW